MLPICKDRIIETLPFCGFVPPHIVIYWRDVWGKSEEWIAAKVQAYTDDLRQKRGFELLQYNKR